MEPGITTEQKLVRARPAAISGDEINAAAGWACVGIGWIVLIIYSLGMWIVSGQATPTVPVLAEAEQWRVPVFRALEVTFSVAVLAVFYFVVYLPRKRTGSLTTSGLVVLTMPLLWFQDPLINYVVPNGVFSSIFFNLGSWTAQVPGAVAPNVNLMPEPLFQGGVYTTLILLQIMGIYWTMRAWKRSHPETPFWKLMTVGMLGALIYDLLLELPAVFLEVWAYPGAIRALSLWPGTAHQFPVYEAPLFGFTTFLWACVLYFKNDRGEMLCEHGIDRLKLSARRKTAVRYLALMGLFQTIFLTSYFMPIWWLSMRADAWPESLPAHLSNGICGKGSDVMCPGPGVPYFRGKNGMLITPEGRLIGAPEPGT
jgi:hypothetical protein